MAMSVKSENLVRESKFISYDSGFLTSCIELKSGSSILTSLHHDTAKNLLSKSKKAEKGRLLKDVQGGIKLTNSVWSAYEDTHTDLHDINDYLRIKDRILSLRKKSKDKLFSPVIVDWGCGAGHTLMQLDVWLKEENIKGARLYGFANEMHPDWKNAPENITFIWDVADHLPSYFEKGSVDLIYSVAGLYYLFLPNSDGHDDIIEFFKKHQFDGSLFKSYPHTEKHLEQLGAILKPTGELLIDLPLHIVEIDYNLLSTSSRNYRTIYNPDKYGEHAYVIFPLH